MGTIKRGILGGFSGKVGTVIGGSWKGIDYMRAQAATVTNPQTVPQLTQRQKFSVIMGFLKPLAQFLKTGFKDYDVKKTEINAAMSYNLKNAVTGAYPNQDVDYPNALVSRGSLPAALDPVAASTVAARVDFTWTDNSTETGADATDQSLLVIYNPVKHQVITDDKQAQRSAGTRNVTVPATFTGDTVQCYMSFINTEGDIASSRYAGQVVVA